MVPLRKGDAKVLRPLQRGTGKVLPLAGSPPLQGGVSGGECEAFKGELEGVGHALNQRVPLFPPLLEQRRMPL